MTFDKTKEYKYKNHDLLYNNLSVGDNGHLFFCGIDTVSLAEKYGTPVYIMDEERIRERINTYKNALYDAFGDNAKVLYASKACSFKRLYEIMREENVGTDVVSCGEIYTALMAGFPLKNAYFHSNNKTDDDIRYAIENEVGYFVVDNEEELYAIDKIASDMGIVQNILLRITPGIDPHTYAKISTGKVDSKFGSAIETGQAEEITSLALSLSNINLVGFHCHVGSQVFDSDVYLRASEVMLTFIADMKNRYGYVAKQLDLGGGYGVRYIESQPTIDIAKNIKCVADFIKAKVAELNISLPVICFEPGRSIVADSGITLYSVGTLKKIPGYKNYVSVDGSMTDNIRFALYGAPYTLMPADNMFAERDMVCSVVGRCCESGDIIQENVSMPEDIKRGNIIACLTTGAYHYSMASNYNKLPRPPIVMINNEKSYIAVKRETIEDLSRNDM